MGHDLIRAAHYTVCDADGRVIWEAKPNEWRAMPMRPGMAHTLACDMSDGSLLLWDMKAPLLGGVPARLGDRTIEGERR